MKFSEEPCVVMSEQLLPDHVEMELDGERVFASAPPWICMHDLLVDSERNELAGIVYAIPESERGASWETSIRLGQPSIRYCISPRLAAEHLRHPDVDLLDIPRNWGESDAQLLRFPEIAKPYRQKMADAMRGEADATSIPPSVMQEGANFFKAIAQEEGSGSLLGWPGGDVDRIEVTWLSKPVHPKLPSYFSSALDVVLAQNFAEDIWFYRVDDGAVVAFGLNHLNRILAEFKLRLPPGLGAD